MTDPEVLREACAGIDPSAQTLYVVRRNGNILLGLPEQGDAALHALRLYQPQRAAARLMVTALKVLARCGLHGRVLSQFRVAADTGSVPLLPSIDRGTCGLLLGSPEHRVRRAIASYRNDGAWEVAKISFGAGGDSNLQQEARVLETLHPLADGVPRLLGLHRNGDTTVLRMPYLTGRPVQQGESREAMELLGRWTGNREQKGIKEFPEWESIQSALTAIGTDPRVLERLSRETLRPVIRHGDFARWNLLRMEDGELMALDWEWGHEQGMPGLDLAHYFLQDARLVGRLNPDDAISDALASLESAICRTYLEKTGWSGDASCVILASLAFKQGAGHQENGEVLRAAVAAVQRGL